jgi:hypothetical protein
MAGFGMARPSIGWPELGRKLPFAGFAPSMAAIVGQALESGPKTVNSGHSNVWRALAG